MGAYADIRGFIYKPASSFSSDPRELLVLQVEWTLLVPAFLAGGLVTALLMFRLSWGRHGRARMAAVLRERRRIALNLHDGVGHGLVVMAMHARRLLSGPGEVSHREVAELIERTAQATLSDLRDTLGVLRAGETQLTRDLTKESTRDLTTELTRRDSLRARRQGGLSTRLLDLAGRFPSSGLDVRFGNAADERRVPPEVAQTAFRVVQEALTNALKHHRGGAGRIHLDVDFGTELTISVINEMQRSGVASVDGGLTGGPAQGAVRGMARGMAVSGLAGRGQGGRGGWARSGSGLAGLRERVAVHGGSLDVGSLPCGGFVTRAVIPLRPAASREEARCGRSAC
jgi:signal transduction histidine kinase